MCINLLENQGVDHQRTPKIDQLLMMQGSKVIRTSSIRNNSNVSSNFSKSTNVGLNDINLYAEQRREGVRNNLPHEKSRSLSPASNRSLPNITTPSMDVSEFSNEAFLEQIAPIPPQVRSRGRPKGSTKNKNALPTRKSTRQLKSAKDVLDGVKDA